jgi:hypothetical protein
MNAHDLPSMQKDAKPAEFLMGKCTDGVLKKRKNLPKMFSARFGVSLREQDFKPSDSDNGSTFSSLSVSYGEKNLHFKFSSAIA